MSRPNPILPRPNVPTRGVVSAARKALIDRMQELNFGRIERLEVRSGDPIFAVETLVVRDIKLASDDRNPTRPTGDFLLKDQVVDLLAEFDRLRDGTVLVLEVKNGLPFRVMLAQRSF